MFKVFELITDSNRSFNMHESPKTDVMRHMTSLVELIFDGKNKSFHSIEEAAEFTKGQRPQISPNSVLVILPVIEM